MNKKLKNGFLGTSILLLFFLVLSQECLAAADVPPSPPILPMTVTGFALIEGTPAPNGTVVTAYLNEKEYHTNTSSGNYSLFIPGTVEDEGKLVTFKVDGKAASSSVAWKSGGIVTLELPDGKVVYSESIECNSDRNSNSNSDSNSNSYLKSNSNLKTCSEPLTDNKEQGVSAEGSKIEVIKSSVPEPNMKTLENKIENSKNKVAAESSENSSKSESAPGFTIVSAIAGLLLLAFGSDLGRRSRRNP